MSGTLTRTVCIKLDVGEHGPALATTQAVFNKAATWISRICWDEGITNMNTAHRRVYGETRRNFGLGAQLACCARAKALEAIKAIKATGRPTCPTFRPRGGLRYDARTYRLLARGGVSLHTLTGRVACRLRPGQRQQTLLGDPFWRIGGAELVWRDGLYFLHITQTRAAPVSDGSGGILGVDLGMVRLATDSEGEAFSGGKVKGMRHYFGKRRRGLQRTGTKSARRRLKQIKRRESRYQKDVNHSISKQLVAKAAGATKALALEDLTGINEQATVRVAQRSWRMGWAFFQLRSFMFYKAAAAGVPVLLVDPASTSQTCSSCGHCEKANRRTQASFFCCACGFATNADVNAARNTAHLAAVNQPMVSDATHRLRRLSSVRVVAPGTSPLPSGVGR